MANSKAQTTEGERGFKQERTLGALRDASRLAKAVAGLAVSLSLLAGLAFGWGPMPDVPAMVSGASSASGPSINVVIGSHHVEICK